MTVNHLVAGSIPASPANQIMNNIQLIKEIVEVDNFYNIYKQREILSHALSVENQWRYNNFLTVDYQKQPFSDFRHFLESGQIRDISGFTCGFDLEDEKTKIFLEDIKNNITEKFGISVDTIKRAMFVFIPPDPTYNKNLRATPHVDYRKDNKLKNFLYYLVDNDAETIFYNQKFDPNQDVSTLSQEILHTVKPKKGKAIIFNGNIYHSSNVSNIYKRLTLNILFREK